MTSVFVILVKNSKSVAINRLRKITMTDKKDFTSDTLLLQCLIRISSLEKLLMEKNLISKDEMDASLLTLTKSIAKTILKDSKVEGDLDSIVSNFIKN